MLVGYIAFDDCFEQCIENTPDFGTLRNTRIDEVTTVNCKVLHTEDGFGVELFVHELFGFGKRYAHGTVNHLTAPDAALVAAADGEEVLGAFGTMLEQKATHGLGGVGESRTCDGAPAV